MSGGKRGKGEKLSYLLPRASAGVFLVECSLSLSFSPRATPTRLTREKWHVTCVPRSAAPVATLPCVRVLYCDICFASVAILKGRKKRKKMPLVLFAFAVLSPSWAPCISDDASLRITESFGDDFEASLRRLFLSRTTVH